MATRHQILAELDAELERESKRVGAELVWSASERAILALIEANRDRAVQTARDYAEATDSKQRRLISAELRLLDSALVSLLKQIKAEAPAEETLTSIKARRAVNVRWDRVRNAGA